MLARTALQQQQPAAVERGRLAQDGAEVARVTQVVEHQQCQLRP
jgi:hypothetical protein